MAYRDRSTDGKSVDQNFCIMEVRLRKKGAPLDAPEEMRLLSVDSHWDTLRFVQENMDLCIGNIVRLKRTEARAAQVNESAQLFRENLKPLMSTMAEHEGPGVMDKLSASLKKALLMLVMERYQSDREQACRVLGISREKLDSELKLCGVSR